MKNKIVVICVILTMLLSLATFTALLVPRISTDTDTEDATVESILEDESIPEDESITKETITFYWDDVEYTVEKGTTFSEFVLSTDMIDKSSYWSDLCPDTGYITHTAERGGTTYMSIDPEGVIMPYEYYGFETEHSPFFKLNENQYDFHNGATWESYLAVMELDHDHKPFVGSIGEFDFIYLNNSVSLHICIAINDFHFDPVASDLIIDGFTYSSCK